MNLLVLYGALAVSVPAPSLPEVVKVALREAEAPRIALARVEQAEAALRSVWADLLPTLSANGTYRRRAFEVVVNRQLDDGTAEQGIFQANDAFAGELRLRSTLFSPRSIPDVQASEDDIEQVKMSAEVTRWDLAYAVAEAYLAARVAELAVAAAARRTEVAARDLERADALEKAGITDASVRDRLELDSLNAETTEAGLRELAARARLNLDLLVGTPVEGELEPFAAELPTTNPQALSAEARVARPDLRVARAAVAAAEHRALAPWLAILPRLGLDGVVNATNETGFNGRAVNWNLALTLDWTLYDGGARYAEARAAVAELEAAHLTLQNLERVVDTELQEGLVVIERARTTLALAEKRKVVSGRYASAIRARSERGLTNAVQAADAAAVAFSADVDHVTGSAELSRAVLNFRRALGRWPF